ncbi:MAG: cytochrome c, class [Candidatus Acidoferrum typicum]|nr:cytochrome c, class [Candidatus Acidoferrum typicum]
MDASKFPILFVGLLFLSGFGPGIHANAEKRGTQAQASQPSETRSVWDGVYTEEQAKRGEELYRKECASCHGDTLVGGGGAAPLTGGTFLSNWNGLTVGDLFDRVRKTMPQGSPGRLTKQQDADILAYLLSFNKFPSGKAELQKQVEFLKVIRFGATKPEPK